MWYTLKVGKVSLSDELMIVTRFVCYCVHRRGEREEEKRKMIKFVLFVNKQGQTRLSQYYEFISVEERVTMEADIVRKCLSRNEDAVSSLHLVGYVQ